MYDIIIIGGGAAGMTAALYSLRSGKSVLLIEKETIGGQISKSPRVENFPSIKEISGSEFSVSSGERNAWQHSVLHAYYCVQSDDLQRFLGAESIPVGLPADGKSEAS